MGTIASPTPAPQHLKALERANQVRFARARIKRRIASGDMSVRRVLIACPSHLATMSITDLLMSQRWWGRTRSRRLLLSVGVAERTPVASLTPRQRTSMAARLALQTGPGNHHDQARA
jgi:hypothetical protein